MQLTPRQLRLLRYIESYSIEQGVSPSFQEMQDFLGVGSKATPHALVKRLIQRGALERTPGRTRALRIIKPHAPHIGRIYDLGFRAGYAAALRRGGQGPSGAEIGE